MKLLSFACLFTIAAIFSGCSDNMTGNPDKSVTVGGAAMYPNKNIVENAMNSADHTTLVAAVKAAGLAETLQGPGPFTVFAPTNEAFNMLPAGSVDMLVKPSSIKTLTRILTSHVVAGKFSAGDLMKMIKNSNDMATLTTLSGHKLMLTNSDDTILIKDEMGGTGQITIGNVYQSNGVIHVVDRVLVPTLYP